MRRASFSLCLMLVVPVFGANGQGVSLKRTLIDSFQTSNGVRQTAPVFDRQRIYYVLSPDTLVLYDIATKRSRQVGVGQWGSLSVSHNGDFLVFDRAQEGSRTAYVWTLPLDPATGLPSGPGRRASMGPGSNPALSPDGKWIAFAADSDHKRLTVIPANGGRERDLLRGPGDFWAVAWSPDGSQIYFTSTIGDKPSHDEVKRIAATGGTPVTISDKDVTLGSISPDGSRVVVDENSFPWRTLAFDPSGRALVPNAMDSAYVNFGSLLSPTQSLDTRRYQPNILKSFTIGSSTIGEAAVLPEDVGQVSWSPDGTRFAAISNAQKPEDLVIASRDGSTRTRVVLPKSLCCWSFDWSPNGRSIAIIGSEDQSARLMVVDVATGKSQVAPTSGIALGAPHWIGDSKHIRYFSGSLSDKGEMRAIRETSIGGPDRLLRELPNRFYRTQSVFASDTTALIVGDSGTSLLSLTSGNAKVLYTLSGGRPAVSPRGDLIVMRPPQRDATGGARRTAEVISPTGAHVATVTFPGIVGFGVLDHFLFTPDQRSIIGTGRDEAGKCCVVYQGFLDGTPTRRLGEVSNASSRGLALSPDGNTLLFTVAGPWLVAFESIDLSGAGRKAPRD